MDRINMRWKVFLSVLNIIAGIVILISPFISTPVVLSLSIIFIGILACFIGGAPQLQAFSTKGTGDNVPVILTLIFGLLLLISPFIAVVLLPSVAGGFAIVAGIASILVSSTVKKAQAAPAE
jgi:uncharacterized membrane protein HdeD (DUF308 family)